MPNLHVDIVQHQKKERFILNRLQGANAYYSVGQSLPLSVDQAVTARRDGFETRPYV